VGDGEGVHSMRWWDARSAEEDKTHGEAIRLEGIT
jgi:hypothetical protein